MTRSSQKPHADASSAQIPVWTWRDAVRQSSVPPLTKLVCYSIANYLADVGQGCFPSVRTLMADTGLSNKSVAAHLQNAVDAGLLVIERRTGRDGRRQLTHYLPRFPSNATLARAAAAMQPTHDDDDADEAAENHVNEVHVDAETGDTHVNVVHADRPSEAASRGPSEPVHVNLAPRELSTRELSIPPKSPDGGPSEDFGFSEGGKLAGLVAEQRTTGRHGDAVEHLLAPLVASGKRLALGSGLAAARAALVEIAAAAHGIPVPALAAAVKRLVASPNKLTVAAIRAEIDLALRAGEMVPIRRGMPEWDAWVSHLEATDRKQAALMQRFDGWQVPRRWPDLSGSVGATDSRPAKTQGDRGSLPGATDSRPAKTQGDRGAEVSP